MPLTETHSTRFSESVEQCLLDLCSSLDGGSRPAPRRPGSTEEWLQLWTLMDQHGIVPAPPADLGSPFPAELRPIWRREHLAAWGANTLILSQLAEIHAAAEQAGLRIAALKGAAGLIWLYENRGGRRLRDLDLLVRPEEAAAASEVLERLGYAQEETGWDAERQAMAAEIAHGAGHLRPDRFRVELHTNLLYAMGDRRLARQELWQDVRLREGPRGTAWTLSPVHFILHGCVHYFKHLETRAASVKNLADLLLAVRAAGDDLDWGRFWATAERWGIGYQAGRVMATLAKLWPEDVPASRPGDEPLPAGCVFYWQPFEYGGPSTRVRRFWRRAGVLPVGSRARYLFRVLVRKIAPAAESLRTR